MWQTAFIHMSFVFEHSVIDLCEMESQLKQVGVAEHIEQGHFTDTQAKHALIERCKRPKMAQRATEKIKRRSKYNDL